eukprot:CAMPEP_0196773384 /NCGR_PEP_ID=MMETSP1104-20130614/2728_1 /TAXON_ID=33652 /ORGANISM="Cafeteria sp., Strain Caron Lab Isolate" /LENGTH=1448 /DNA_ID=CAMNT_0042143529 /DNA_START=14 /DNA_END=4356 /DNA_ORIENTATION=-
MARLGLALLLAFVAMCVARPATEKVEVSTVPPAFLLDQEADGMSLLEEADDGSPCSRTARFAYSTLVDFLRGSDAFAVPNEDSPDHADFRYETIVDPARRPKELRPYMTIKEALEAVRERAMGQGKTEAEAWEEMSLFLSDFFEFSGVFRMLGRCPNVFLEDVITRFVFNLRMEESLIDAVQKGHWLPGTAKRLKTFVSAVKTATKEYLVDRVKSLKDKVVGRMRQFWGYMKRKFSDVTDKTVDEVLAEEMENADYGSKEQAKSVLVDREYVPRWLLSEKNITTHPARTFNGLSIEGMIDTGVLDGLLNRTLSDMEYMRAAKKPAVEADPVREFLFYLSFNVEGEHLEAKEMQTRVMRLDERGWGRLVRSMRPNLCHRLADFEPDFERFAQMCAGVLLPDGRPSMDRWIEFWLHNDQRKKPFVPKTEAAQQREADKERGEAEAAEKKMEELRARYGDAVSELKTRLRPGVRDGPPFVTKHSSGVDYARLSHQMLLENYALAQLLNEYVQDEKYRVARQLYDLERLRRHVVKLNPKALPLLQSSLNNLQSAGLLKKEAPPTRPRFFSYVPYEMQCKRVRQAQSGPHSFSWGFSQLRSVARRGEENELDADDGRERVSEEEIEEREELMREWKQRPSPDQVQRMSPARAWYRASPDNTNAIFPLIRDLLATNHTFRAVGMFQAANFLDVQLSWNDSFAMSVLGKNLTDVVFPLMFESFVTGTPGTPVAMNHGQLVIRVDGPIVRGTVLFHAGTSDRGLHEGAIFHPWRMHHQSSWVGWLFAGESVVSEAAANMLSLAVSYGGLAGYYTDMRGLSSSGGYGTVQVCYSPLMILFSGIEHAIRERFVAGMEWTRLDVSEQEPMTINELFELFFQPRLRVLASNMDRTVMDDLSMLAGVLSSGMFSAIWDEVWELMGQTLDASAARVLGKLAAPWWAEHGRALMPKMRQALVKPWFVRSMASVTMKEWADTLVYAFARTKHSMHLHTFKYTVPSAECDKIEAIFSSWPWAPGEEPLEVLRTSARQLCRTYYALCPHSVSCCVAAQCQELFGLTTSLSSKRLTPAMFNAHVARPPKAPMPHNQLTKLLASTRSAVTAAALEPQLLRASNFGRGFAERPFGVDRARSEVGTVSDEVQGLETVEALAREQISAIRTPLLQQVQTTDPKKDLIRAASKTEGADADVMDLGTLLVARGAACGVDFARDGSNSMLRPEVERCPMNPTRLRHALPVAYRGADRVEAADRVPNEDVPLRSLPPLGPLPFSWDTAPHEPWLRLLNAAFKLMGAPKSWERVLSWVPFPDRKTLRWVVASEARDVSEADELLEGRRILSDDEVEGASARQKRAHGAVDPTEWVGLTFDELINRYNNLWPLTYRATLFKAMWEQNVDDPACTTRSPVEEEVAGKLLDVEPEGEVLRSGMLIQGNHLKGYTLSDMAKMGQGATAPTTSGLGGDPVA